MCCLGWYFEVSTNRVVPAQWWLTGWPGRAWTAAESGDHLEWRSLQTHECMFVPDIVPKVFWLVEPIFSLSSGKIQFVHAMPWISLNRWYFWPIRNVQYRFILQRIDIKPVPCNIHWINAPMGGGGYWFFKIFPQKKRMYLKTKKYIY